MSFQLVSVILVFVVSLYFFREKLTAFFGSLFFAASPVLLFSGINGKETTSDYFLFMIAPLAIYNAYTFGNPIFSSNSLFQFVQSTRAIKYMNPWWKLSYPFDTANPLSALNMFSGDILSRTQSTIIGTFNDFLAVGQTATGFSWFWWIPIAVSAIAGIWPRLSKGTGFPFPTTDQSNGQARLCYFVIFNYSVGLPILGVY